MGTRSTNNYIYSDTIILDGPTQGAHRRGVAVGVWGRGFAPTPHLPIPAAGATQPVLVVKLVSQAAGGVALGGT